LRAEQPIDLRCARIGYAPYSSSFERPGDKRRFVYYAKRRGLNFEIANPSQNYDLVVITQNADISIWSQYERGRAQIVYDLIDSYLAVPKSNIKGSLRGLAKYLSGQSRYLKLSHWKAVADMCVRANAVVCTTPEQRANILRFCPNAHIVLDAHIDVVTSVKMNYRAKEPFRLIWEGLPQNLKHLSLLRPVLDRLRAQYDIEVHVVTDPFYYRYLGKYRRVETLKLLRQILPDVRFHEWTEASCASIICSCDLAVIPLDLDDRFAAGKPENKLLLLWRMGMPVVTSASPAYDSAMRSAGINYAARDQSDWTSMLSALISNEPARKQAGQAGKAYVDREFSEASLLGKWDSIFESLGFTITR
jgi:glycosyltransferase involved in cell wall biosynthesis